MEETFELGNMTSDEIREKMGASLVAFLPIGSIEQHGPYLPLKTDAFLVECVARRVAELVSNSTPILLLPTVWFGVSSHHMDFAGTLSLTPETFVNVLTEIGLSLVQHGVRKIFFLNGHGGNRASVQVAATKLRDTTSKEVFVASASYWDFLPHERVKEIRSSKPGGMSHAGELETSCMLYLSDLVKDFDPASAACFMPEWGTPYFRVGMFVPRPVTIAYHICDLSPIGSVGDPTSATREKGKAFFEAIVKGIVPFIEDFSTWSYERIKGEN